MANKNYTAQVILTMNAKEAKKELDTIKTKLNDTEHAMDRMAASGQKDTDAFKKLEKEARMLKSAQSQLEGQLLTVEQVMNNMSRVSLRQMEQAYRALQQRVKNNTRSTAELREQMVKDIASMKRLETEIAKLSGQWKTQEGAIKSVIKRLTAYVGVYGAFNFLKGKVMNVVKENIAFSDSLADIRKSTGLTTKEVGELSDAINKIDTRTSRQELHDLAYEAGRMGLGKYGVAGIDQFVKAADQLKVALGEDLGDDAILQLTKMADVMGLMGKYGVEDSLLKVGSAINELAQNSTAKGTYITDFASRLSGVSRQCGMTTSDLFGLAAASDALALETEVSATAMSKFLVQLSQYDKQEGIAKAAGMEVEALRELIGGGQMGEAVLQVLQGLGKRGGLGELAPVMKTLGSDGSRMINIFSTLASNVDKVRENMALASAAFEEGTSVTNEFNIKNNTAAAIMERTANSWKALMVNFKNSAIAKDIAVTIKQLSDELQRNGVILWTLRTTLNIIVAALRAVVQLLPAIAIFGIIKGVSLLAGGIVKLAASAGGATGRLGKLAVTLGLLKKEELEAARGANALSKELSAMQKANIFLALASIITSVAIPAIQNLTKHIRDTKSNFKDIKESVSGMNAEVAQSTDKASKAFDKLEKLQKEGKEGSVEYLKVEKELNKEHGELLKGLTTETGHIKNLSEARDVLNEKLKQSIAYRMREKLIGEAETDGYREQADAMMDLQSRLEKKGMSQQQIENVLAVLRNNASLLGDQTGGQKFWGTSSGTGKVVAQSIRENGGNVASDFWRNVSEAFGVTMVSQLFGGDAGSAQLMQSVENYAHSVMTTDRKKKVINGMLDGMIGDYIPEFEDMVPGGGSGAEDGGKSGKGTKLARAKKQYEAFMSLIEAYYNKKKALVREDFVAGKMTETQLAQTEEDINKERLRTLMAAGNSIMGYDEGNKAWNNLTMQLLNTSKLTDDHLADLAEQLVSKDMDAFGPFLRSFGEEMTDGIINGIEKRGAELADIEVNIQKAVAKALLERDAIGKVKTQYAGEMERLGILSYFIPDDQTAKEAMMHVMDQMMEVYESGTLFGLSDEEVPAAMSGILSGIDGLDYAMRNLSGDQLLLLYDYMMRFGAATDEARRRVESLRHNDLIQKWDRSAEGQGYAAQARSNAREGNFIGQVSNFIGGSVASNRFGIKTASDDLAAITAKIAMLRQQGDAEAELIKLEDERQQAEDKLTEAILENTKLQADAIRSLGDVLESAADQWGEYLGTTYESEEDAASARIDIWDSMVDSAGSTVKELLQTWATEAITTAMVNRAKAAQQKATNVEMEVEQARHTATMVAAEVTEVEAVGAAETAKAGAKAIGSAGVAGVALAAVAAAAIAGIISYAMAKLKKSSTSSSSSTGSNRRLVTGMLTYDEGNVQAMAANGSIVSATLSPTLPTGLVTSPTLTTVNGQAALVAERGPELIFGRETTAALMRNDPLILSSMIEFDKHYSGRRFAAYDGGNAQQFGMGSGQLVTVINRLNAILDGGIGVNMWGENGLYKSQQRAEKFMRGKES